MSGYLIDASLPRRFLPWSGREDVFADDLGQSWSETQLWDYAVQHALTIVSRDIDYSARAQQTKSGPHIIIVEVYRDRLVCIGD